MEYIKDPELLDHLLKETFKPLNAIFEDNTEWQTVRVYDVRGMSFDQKILEAVRTVFGVVENKSKELLLVEHPKRGWEICGGHLTIDEVQGLDLFQALKREVLEESGFTIANPSLAFLAHVLNKEDSINRELGCPYPKQAVMATYRCDAGEKVSETLLDDIKQASFFTRQKALDVVRSRNRAIIGAL